MADHLPVANSSGEVIEVMECDGFSIAPQTASHLVMQLEFLFFFSQKKTKKKKQKTKKKKTRPEKNCFFFFCITNHRHFIYLGTSRPSG